MAFALGSKSIGAYTEMSAQSRKTLEVFSRDIRAADNVTAASKERILVTFPENDFYDGQSVEYVFDDLIGLFSRIERERTGT